MTTQWTHLCQSTIDAALKFHIETHRLRKVNSHGKFDVNLICHILFYIAVCHFVTLHAISKLNHKHNKKIVRLCYQ